MWSAEGDIPKEVRPSPDIDDWQQKIKKDEKVQNSRIVRLFRLFYLHIVVTSKLKTS